MDLEVDPYAGIGPVRLGASVREVREAVGARPVQFKKSEDSEMLTDDFGERGLHVYYKKPGLCEAVEVFPEANPTFRGRRLLGEPLGEMLRWFRSIDPDVEVDESGLISYEFGIALYAPQGPDAPDDPAESAFVFARGYYGG